MLSLEFQISGFQGRQVVDKGIKGLGFKNLGIGV